MTRHRRVLIVDDDEWFVDEMARQLRSEYDMRKVHDAVAAMAALDVWQFAAVVLDMHLPAVNGLALLHEMQSHEDLASIPVVVISSETYDDAELAPYGVRSVLDKTSMRYGDLLAALRRELT